jgi:hypothetical protein
LDQICIQTQISFSGTQGFKIRVTKGALNFSLFYSTIKDYRQTRTTALNLETSEITFTKELRIFLFCSSTTGQDYRQTTNNNSQS